MSTFIDGLAKIGANAELRYADTQTIVDFLRSTQVDVAALELFKSNGSRALEIALGVQPNVCCGLYPVEDDQRAA